MARALALLAAAACVNGNALMGIDLGHEFMKVALVKPGMPFQVISNFQSKRKTPTLVSFYDRERWFGADAESLSARKPHLVFSRTHSLLGRNGSHPVVEDYIQGSFLAAETAVNERGGLDFVVPAGDSIPRFTALPEDGAEVAQEGAAVRYSAEEVTAMMLAHASDFASHIAGTRVVDAVLCVHPYATQNERRALLDAAELAGLSVIALVDENTAAAVHYGIDRVFENTTHYMILYNMGSEATQVTLMAYDSYTAFTSGQTRPVGQGRVVAKAWDTRLGGRHLDRAIMNYAAEKFNTEKGKALPASAKGDIRNVPSAMAKLRKNVARVKEILSANEEYQMVVEGILPDVDFKLPLSRSSLDSIATDAGLLQRITAPIESVLSQANMTLSEIDVVEIIGGGVRVPRVQAILRDFVTAAIRTDGSPVALGQHLNGDEAMALGAAFSAANRSASFRVRKVGIIDGYPFGIGTRITLLGGGNMSDAATGSAAAAAAEEAAIDAVEGATPTPSVAAVAPGKAWSKRSSLFRAYNPLESTKRITFASDKDLRVTLFYETTSVGAPALPEGTSRTLAYFNVTGIETLLENDAMRALGVPKIQLSFELDVFGMAQLARAEATLEEEYIPTPVPTPIRTPTPVPVESNATDANASDASATASPAPSANATVAAADANANATVNGSSNASEASPTPMAPRKRTHRFPLTVSVDHSSALSVKPLSAAEKAASLSVLRHLDRLDEQRRAREGAKNALEAYIYSTRDKMSSSEEEVAVVSTEAQREAVSTGLSENEDWLYGDGAAADISAYKTKLAELKAAAEPIFKRMEELAARPKVINDTQTHIRTVRQLAAAFETTHPQITVNETAELLTAVDTFETWFNETLAAQEALGAAEDPVLTRELVTLRTKIVSDKLTRLMRKPKPTPTPTPFQKKNSTASATPTPKAGSKKTAPSAKPKGMPKKFSAADVDALLRELREKEAAEKAFAASVEEQMEAQAAAAAEQQQAAGGEEDAAPPAAEDGSEESADAPPAEAEGSDSDAPPEDADVADKDEL